MITRFKSKQTIPDGELQQGVKRDFADYESYKDFIELIDQIHMIARSTDIYATMGSLTDREALRQLLQRAHNQVVSTIKPNHIVQGTSSYLTYDIQHYEWKEPKYGDSKWYKL